MPSLNRMTQAVLGAMAFIFAAAALTTIMRARSHRVDLAALPGAQPYAAELNARLQRATTRIKDDDVRTRHRQPDGSPKYTNRLVLERSPYLLQHAHNPVDWYPWGDEAFERARREHKPVLLSVGYSTCHWCHVMEEESFDDEEIAAYLNANYVAIKVDREQRPDVDGVYMAAVQRLTNGGGWPMTLWLTPDRHPFYGGTYYPPRDGARGVRVGFLTLLQRLRAVYDERGDEARAAGADLVAQIESATQGPASSSAPTTQPLLLGYAHFRKTFDRDNGGFGAAPKFPRPASLSFLLRYHRRSGDAAALDMVVRSLDAMARGGIYDHVGGGFHRYATDAAWRIPHFEKMLYDNALLAITYLEAYQVTHDPALADIARDILRYIAREMTSPDGGFFAASDADSEGREGKFFVWTPAEIAAVVGTDDAPLVSTYYGVTPEGNFEGATVLTELRPVTEVAESLGLDAQSVVDRLSRARDRLYAARQQRVAPHTDHKVITAWNGLMISAFARAAVVLQDPKYAAVAERAAGYVLSRAGGGDRLPRSIVEGDAVGSGYLDDYAFTIAALLDLFEATHAPARLEQALALQRYLDGQFWDAKSGGYFFTGSDQEDLFAREKPSYDGSEPSGNSVALHNLMRLYALTSDEQYRERAEEGLRQFAGELVSSPGAVPYMLAALDFYSDKFKEVVIVAAHDPDEARPFLAKRAAAFVPNSVVVVARTGDEMLSRLVPLLADKTARNGRATAYVCERRVCDLPTSDPNVFARQLAKVDLIPNSEKSEAVAEGHGAP